MKQKIKILLIAGAENTGKTTIIKRIINWLENDILNVQKKNVRNISNLELIKGRKKDFFCILEKNDNIKFFISTASDNEKIINNFMEFCKKNNYKQNNFIIAPIRNIGDKNREYFINVIGKITSETDFEKDIIEITLNKICKEAKNVEYIKWYINSMCYIAQKILEQGIFNVK